MTETEAIEIIKNAKPIELELHQPQCPVVDLKTAKPKTLEEKQQDLERLKEFYNKRRKYNNISKRVRYGTCR